MLCAPLLLSVSLAAAPQTPAASAPRWYRGNTHAHTIDSDGDSSPEEVVRWYREHRYHFLILTDHNLATPLTGLASVFDAPGHFLLIPGEEISDHAGKTPVHVNALGVAATIPPQGGERPADVLRRDVEAARAAGGLAQINHPNFGWALTAADILQAPSAQLLEIANAHPFVNNLGGGGAPSTEALWDELLSAGRAICGVASDDLHDLKDTGIRRAAGPGRAWVMVRASRLTAEDILAALARGDFYASTGVELFDVRAGQGSVALSVREREDERYRIQFIGKGGRILKEVEGGTATYQPDGTEGYVRAKVTSSNGHHAWTQPVRVLEAAR